MKSSAAVCLLCVFAAASGFGSGGNQRPKPSDIARNVDELFAEWTKPGSPGGAVILVDNGKVILRRCYGLADVEHGVPVTPATRFELASVSKSFTAFAVLLLEKAGKLKLEDDVRAYLHELPVREPPVTVAHLVHHTSGISDVYKMRSYAGQYGNSGFGPAEHLSFAARQRILEFETGSVWSYSNTNYALLAEIVARVTGRSYGEWMRDNVFEPLGMHRTSFPADGKQVLPDRANAYSFGSDGTLRRSLVEEFSIPGPAHAFSTIGDMGRWADNFRTGKVGGLDIIGKMQEKPILSTGETSFYGAGVGMGEYRGVKTVGHSGQTGAFKSELMFCPDLGVGVVILGNVRSMNPAAITRRVLDLYLGDRLKPIPQGAADAADPSKEAPFLDIDSVSCKRIIGGYRLEAAPSVLVALSREGDYLVGMRSGGGTALLRPRTPSVFETEDRNVRVEFSTEEGEEHPAGRVRITLRGQKMEAVRVTLPADSRWIDECLGWYFSEELGAGYEIARSSDGLVLRIGISPEIRTIIPVDADILMGGIGMLTLLRDASGRMIGFDFGEPEDLGHRLIRFHRCGNFIP